MATLIFDLQRFDDPPEMPGEGGGTQPGEGGESGGGSSVAPTTRSAATVVTSAETLSGEYTSSNADENAILVSTTATVQITNATVTKTGGESAGDNYSFYGINSAIMCLGGGSTSISGGTVTTNAAGANGIFSYGANSGTTNAQGDGTTVYISNVEITTSQQGSGGIMTTFGGTTYATDLTITTSGGSSAPIRTDRGGGWVYVSGGTYTSNGTGSPAIYSTADVNVSDATLTSTQSEGVCIEGAGSIKLKNCNLTATNSARNGKATFLDTIMIYQSMSGDASDGTSVFTMDGGSLTSNSGHVFHVTNTAATINLNGVTITNNDSNGVLLSVCDDGWTSTSGTVTNSLTFNATDQTLTGTILVGDDSTLNLNLSGSSTFTGNVSGTISNAAGTSVSSDIGTVNVTLADDAKWNLTENTYITSFTGDPSNVIANGFKLYESGNEVTGTTDSEDTGLTIYNTDTGVLVSGTEYADSINNSGSDVTINAAGGNDFIGNSSDNVSIDAGEGNDSIISRNSALGADGGENVTINAGAGDDFIAIGGGSSVTANGGAGNDSIYNSASGNISIDAGEGNDVILNNGLSATVDGGTDTTNGGENVTINAGAGDDSIQNLSGNNVSINAGEGNDTINNSGSNVTIDGGADNDFIQNDGGNNVSISGGEGNDTILNNYTYSVTGSGDDTEAAFVGAENVSIDAGAGDDAIFNYGAPNTNINAGDGDDFITNGYIATVGDSTEDWNSDNATINGGAGNDTIRNISGSGVSIDGGEGNDLIQNSGTNVTILASAGSDSISGVNSTTNIVATVSSSSVNGDNVILTTNDGTLTILDGKGVTFNLNGAETLFSGTAPFDTENATTNTDTGIVVSGTENDDVIVNSADSVSIDADGGNDSIQNTGADVSINGGNGNNYIVNGALVNTDSDTTTGDNATITTGDGNDSVWNYGAGASINVGDGANYVSVAFDYTRIGDSDTVGPSTSITAGAGNDTIYTTKVDNSSFDAGDGNNYIEIDHSYNNTITTGAGNDTLIVKRGSSITAFTGDGDDTIAGDFAIVDNDWTFGRYATVDAGNGNDLIFTYYANLASLYGGAGNDTLVHNGENSTLNGGAGDDLFTLTNLRKYDEGAFEPVVIVAGEGNDTLQYVQFDDKEDYSSTFGTVTAASTTSIQGAFTSSSVDGDNVILTGDNGSLTIVNGKGVNFNINGTDSVIGAAETPASLLGAASLAAEYTMKRTADGYTALAGNTHVESIANPPAPTNYYSSETWTTTSADNLTLSAVHYSPDEPTGKWAILVHAYGYSGTSMHPFATAYLAQGFDVLEIDQRAAGNSGGDWLTMGVAESADLALWTQEVKNANANAQIVLHGVSMGAATVLLGAALSQTTNVAALIEDCSYDDIGKLFANEVSGFLEQIDITGEEFYNIVADVVKENNGGYEVRNAAPIDVIAQVTVPSLFIHGTADTLIPVSVMSELYNASGAAIKDSLPVEGAAHAMSAMVDSGTYLSTAINFIGGVTSQVGASINSADSDKLLRGTIYDDTITSSAANVTIDSGKGNDSISINGDNVVVSAGAGNDTVSGVNSTTNIQADYSAASVEGNDVILTTADGSVTLVDAKSKDFYLNGVSTVFSGDETNDTVISGTDSDDSLSNSRSNVSIGAGDGNDTITNGGSNVTVDAGAGNNSITNTGANTSILGGSGNNTVNNSGSNVSIDAGAGDDYISNSGYNVWISASPGYDTISGINSTTNIVANVTDSSISGQNVILTTSDGNLTLENAKGQSFMLNDTETLFGAENSELIELGAGDSTVVGDVKYTAIDSAATLTTDSDGAVTGITEGKVDATINEATSTPTIRLDGTNASFDFTASVDSDALILKAFDYTFAYVSGNVTYSESGIDFPAGDLTVRLTDATNAAIFGDITLHVPEGDMDIELQSSTATFNLTQEVSADFAKGLLTGSAAFNGKFSYDISNKRFDFVEGAALALKDITAFGGSVGPLNVGLGALSNSVLQIEGSGLDSKLAIKDGSAFKLSGDLFVVDANVSVSGGDVQIGVLNLLQQSDTSTSVLTLTSGTTISVDAGIGLPISLLAKEETDYTFKLSDTKLSVTSDGDKGIYVAASTLSDVEFHITGELDYDTATGNLELVSGTAIAITVSDESGTAISTITNKTERGTVALNPTNGKLSIAENSKLAIKIDDGDEFTFENPAAEEATVSFVNGTLTYTPDSDGNVFNVTYGSETSSLEIKSGSYSIDSEGNFSVSSDSEIVANFTETYSIDFKPTDTAGGKLAIVDKGLQFTPNDNDGKLALSVTNSGTTRNATAEFTGTVTIDIDGNIILAKDSVNTVTFEDGTVLKITAKGEENGVVSFDSEKGLTITDENNNLELELTLPNGNALDIDSISGTVAYKGATFTMYEGTGLHVINNPSSIEQIVSVESGTAVLDFSEISDDTDTSYIVTTAADNSYVTTKTVNVDKTAILCKGTSKFGTNSQVLLPGVVAYGAAGDSGVGATTFSLDGDGEYTVNGFTVTVSNIDRHDKDHYGTAIRLIDNKEISFVPGTATISYDGEDYTGNYLVQIAEDSVSTVLYYAGSSTLLGRTFTMTEDVASGVTITASENGFTVAHHITEAEALQDPTGKESDIGQILTERIAITGDNTYTVALDATGMKALNGISNGATVKVDGDWEGAAEGDVGITWFDVVTDSEGVITLNDNAVTISGDSSVNISSTFTSDLKSSIAGVTDLNGTISVGAIYSEVAINSALVTIEGAPSKLGIVADSSKVSLTGFTDSATVTSSQTNNFYVETKANELNLNGVDYNVSSNPNGMSFGNNSAGVLAANASMTVSQPGRYTVNDTTLNVKSGDTIIGVSSDYAYIYSADAPNFTSDTTTDEILDKLGIPTANVTDVTDEDAITLENTAKSTAVVGESATGKMAVALGERGSAAIVKDTEADLTVVGGKGNDTLVTEGKNVHFDMTDGGKDKIIATAGNVTLNNYNPLTKSGIQVTPEDLAAGVKLADDMVKLSNATISLGGAGNYVNLFMPDESEITFGFASSEDTVVDATAATASESMVLIGGQNYRGVSLDSAVDGAMLLGGAGNDSVYGGAGAYIDPGAGKNYVSMSNEGGSTLNISGGKTTVDGFNFGTSETADTLETGALTLAGVKVTNDGDVVITTSNGEVQLNDAENKVIKFNNDYTVDDINLVAAKDSLNVTENGFYWASGKNAEVALKNYNGDSANVNLSNTNYNDTSAISFYGDVKDVDASGYANAATITGNDKSNVIVASDGGSTMYGGAGNDTFTGGAGEDEFVVGTGRNVVKNFDTVNDKLNLGSAAITGVTAKNGNVVFTTADGATTVEGAAGKSMMFQNNYTNGEIELNAFNNSVNVTENGLYWAGGSNATVSIGSNYSGGSNVFNLADSNFTNKEQVSFYGNIKALDASNYSGDTTLYGNSANNVITASSGNSTLWGGSGGNDTLIAGSGDDRFIYGKGNGNDVIQGASSNDTVILSGISLSDLTATGTAIFSGNDLKFNVNDGGSLTVKDGKTSGVAVEISGTTYYVENGAWKTK